MTSVKEVIRILGIVLILLGSGSCDLTEPNPNEPDRERALNNPGDIETLVSGTFLLWWQVNHGLGTAAETRPASAVGALSALGNEVTASAAHYGIQDIGLRPVNPILNDPGSSWHPYVEGTWQELYKVISATRTSLLALAEPGFHLGPDGRDNARLEAFSKFMQGMAHGTLGYIYREAYIVDEGVSDEELASLTMRPYGEVMDAALGYLEEAANLATVNSFTIPSNWIPGVGTSSHSSQDLARIANSYRARFMAGVARTPAERDGVDWAQVLMLAESGVIADFGVEADGPGGVWKADIRLATGASSTSGGGRGIHHDIVGPADQTGAYQEWKASDYTARREITIETDDRRIHGPEGPTTIGTQVQWWPTPGMNAARGLYYFSLYRDLQHRDYRDTQRGFLVDMSVKELDFLKAESHIRLGNPQAAADLINITRAKGELPPVTPEGTSGDRCVPRTVTGACGSLMDALKYEKGLELWLYAMGVRLSDVRGWGDQEEGLAIHLPVPKNELELAGHEFYTTGGIGGIDASPGGN